MTDTPAGRADKAKRRSYNRPTSRAQEQRLADAAEGTAVAHFLTGAVIGILSRPESPVQLDIYQAEPLTTGPGGIFDVKTRSGHVLRIGVTYLRTEGNA